MEKITAETLTVDQVRTFMCQIENEPNTERLWKSALVVLFGSSTEDLRHGETRAVARTRIATAINARGL